MSAKTPEQMNQDLMRPMEGVSARYLMVLAIFLSVITVGVAAFGWQVNHGLGVSGLRRPVFWGFYITNFVFWIGLSHAGTLISAILRIANATWRRPVTRCAEVITVFSLSIGATFPIIHLGRPWLFFWLIPYPNERGIWPNIRSPLAWDFFAISTYLLGSGTFLLLPILPDLALVRDRSRGLRKKIYTILAIGWRGTPREWHRLEKAMQIMAVAVIPVAVSVHSIVSWDFAMAPVPGWHTTIFAPYFVVGAIFSGIAALIIAMAIMRKLLRLEQYLLPIHFENLGKLLLVMTLVWLYMVFAEHLTGWYGNEPSEMVVFWSNVTGSFSPLFWAMIICNVLIPFPILAIKKLRTINGCVIASIGIVIGMWLERYLIIVPSLSRKYLPYSWVTAPYRPTWVEISITAATFAAMPMLFMLLTKFIPIISVWELKWGQHQPEEHEPVLVRKEVEVTG